MPFDREGAEQAGWVFASEEPGRVRAEKFVPAGIAGEGLINFQGETEAEVVRQIHDWEHRVVAIPPAASQSPVGLELLVDDGAPDDEPEGGFLPDDDVAA